MSTLSAEWQLIPWNAEVKVCGVTLDPGGRYQALWDCGLVVKEKDGSRFRAREILSTEDCQTREDHEQEVLARYRKWKEDRGSSERKLSAEMDRGPLTKESVRALRKLHSEMEAWGDSRSIQFK